jgi:hypothetical protein
MPEVPSPTTVEWDVILGNVEPLVVEEEVEDDPVAEEEEETEEESVPSVECVDCCESVPEEDARHFLGNWHCEGCTDNDYRVCDRCSDYDTTENTSYVSGDTWCSDCVSSHSWSCGSCDETLSDEVGSYGVQGENEYVCGECRASYYTRCNGCREYYPDSDSCNNCGEEEEEYTVTQGPLSPDQVCDYGYRPKPIFFGNLRSVMYGVELEVNAELDTVHETLRLLDRRHVYAKSDSSIGGGYEIVSHPHTLEEHRKLWPNFFANLPDGVTSFKSGNCGMHVHISRSHLTRLQIGKMLVFVNAPQNKDFIEKIAQRSGNRYCKVIEKKLSSALEIDGDRYQAINITNRHTVEVRIFRGTTRSDRFWKNLEFVDAMVQWTRDVSYRDLSAARFVEYVVAKQREYKYLHNYLIEIGYIDPLEQIRKEILASCA